MTHAYNERAMRKAAANCRNHTGAAKTIRECLAGRRLTVDAIALETGLKHQVVKQAIGGLMGAGGAGGIYRERGANGVTYYTTIRPEERPREIRLRRGAGSGKIAGRITVGRGSFWGAGPV